MMMLPPLLWTPSPNFSQRNARVDLLVLHSAEGQYEGTIAWFQKPESQVSAHYVIKSDGSEATQMVDLGAKAWHAVAFNSRSVGLEMAGFAAKGFDSAEWAAAANIFAFLCHHLQIPVRHAMAGVGPGIASHFDLGVAGGSHRDPGTDPTLMLKFVNLVATQYNIGDFPALWEPANSPAKCSLSS